METERLILRRWDEDDAAELYEMCLDDSLKKSGIHSFNSVDEALDCIKNRMNDPCSKAIVEKESGCLIGMISLGDMNRYEGYMELEYAISAEYRGKGYVEEAVRRMVDYGFRSLDLSVISAWVRSHNKASIRVLEKCSFTFDGRLRKHARDKSDTCVYSILKEEWKPSGDAERNSHR